LTGCPNLTDGSGGDITYEVEQEEGSSSKTDSTGIKLSFSAALSSLTVREINVNDDDGAVIKGALTGEGAVWHLALSVTTQGNVKVSISKSGIENAVKTVAVYKKAAATDADREAVDKLTENEAAQAGLVTADALAKEGAVEALTSVEDAQAKAVEIKTALDAYNALSPEAKALLPAETKAKFEALAAILAEVNARITELAEENASPADREAANGLTKDEAVQAGLATADALAKEGAVAALTSVEDAQDKAAEIKTALDAYNALSPEAKALLPAETKAEFEALAAILAEVNARITELAEENASPADREAADSFRNTYRAILEKTTDNVIISDKEAVQAALTAYDSLTDAVKDLLTNEKTLLDGLSTKIGQLETAAAETAANQQAANDFTSTHSAALALTVANVEITNKTAVQAALTAYNGLSAAVKALLPADTGTKLQALLDQIDVLEADTVANAFRTTHAAILAKTTANVAISDKTAVNAALAAYDALSAPAKALLTNEKAKLDELLAKIADLEAAANANLADREAADSFRNTYSAILEKTTDNVVIANKTAVQAAQTAYNGLTDAVKDLLTSEKDLLVALLAKIADLEAAENASVEELEAAATFRTTHSAALALTVSTVQLSNSGIVDVALSDFNDLSETVKVLLSSEKGKLDSLKAKIDLLGTGSVTVTFSGLPQDETSTVSGGTGTISWTANTTITFTVSGTFTAYAWVVDGQSVTGAITGTLTLHAQNYSVGTHTVTAKVTTQNEITWSKQARFSIGE
jgi:hypothetical protein